MTDIGATLREARLRRSLDIIEVERATKIRAKYLRAMEDEEWSLLPGPTFVKSFLRTYADHLGLDSRLLVEEWSRRHERVSEGELPPLAPRSGRSGRGGARASRGTRPAREPGRWRGPVLAGLLVVGLLAGLYLLGTRSSSSDDDPLPAPRGRTTSGASGGSGGSGGKAGAGTARAKRASGRVRLQLRATAPLYVCLVDGTGRRLINGTTLAPGRPTRVFRARRFRVNLGNASVVMRVNGRRMAVPDSSSGIGLEIGPKGRRALPAGRRPSCA